ncbi:MAG TPA: AMP-binding protein [Solirubrobacteraceae bacterium]|jgi:acyl-coenzyme A synthetase/AMP-(fatty) acid ligase|nr:AMP-binding protein [Solirubrobacteraceae bacterium]
MNFASEVVDAADPERLALLELARDGTRREWTFGEVAAASKAFASALAQLGVRRGDAVMTLVGNRPDWVITLVACWRIGAVALPCSEQLRAGDIQTRLTAAAVRAVVCDERNTETLQSALAQDGSAVPTLIVGGPAAVRPSAAPSSEDWPELAAEDPALIIFTSGTTGNAKGIVHGTGYLFGQQLQATEWLAPKAGDLVWCTAASGWSKAARNTFIAPWLRGAAGLLHDARFDPHDRLEIVERERVNVLCMAPTEYRVIAKHATLRAFPDLHALVAAGEALDPDALRAWRQATGLDVRDGYGQTETGQLTANPAGVPARPSSMGRPLPGVRLEVVEGELVLADPTTDPTFFVGYLDGTPAPRDRPWHTGDLVRVDDDGYLYFEGRHDDVIISAGYRIGPFEVESALLSHAAVADAGVVAAPDTERGSVVRAVVVLRDGFAPSDALVTELQEHVKNVTAPYKYPRVLEFSDELPKTASGKIQRALLRQL